jgi:hypothetical protein
VCGGTDIYIGLMRRLRVDNQGNKLMLIQGLSQGRMKSTETSILRITAPHCSATRIVATSTYPNGVINGIDIPQARNGPTHYIARRKLPQTDEGSRLVLGQRYGRARRIHPEGRHLTPAAFKTPPTNSGMENWRCEAPIFCGIW